MADKKLTDAVIRAPFAGHVKQRSVAPGQFLRVQTPVMTIVNTDPLRVRLKVPELDDALAESVVRLINAMRAMPLRKSPSISETIDWARTLLALGATTLSDDIVRDTLGVVLKHADDATKARTQLELT